MVLKRGRMTKRKKQIQVQENCWLCGLPVKDDESQDGATIISVACDKPGGEPTEKHDVKVHFHCYMDVLP